MQQCSAICVVNFILAYHGGGRFRKFGICYEFKMNVYNLVSLIGMIIYSTYEIRCLIVCQNFIPVV